MYALNSFMEVFREGTYVHTPEFSSPDMLVVSVCFHFDEEEADGFCQETYHTMKKP